MARRTTIQCRYLKAHGLPSGLVLKRAVVQALRTPHEGATNLPDDFFPSSERLGERVDRSNVVRSSD